MSLAIREDDLSGEAVRALLATHLRFSVEDGPCTGHSAYGLDDLMTPDVTVWSAWDGDALVGVGALKATGPAEAVIKSMHVAASARGRGHARTILHHIEAAAKARGLTHLLLETGATPGFAPAVALYRAEGYTDRGPFHDHRATDGLIFMEKHL